MPLSLKRNKILFQNPKSVFPNYSIVVGTILKKLKNNIRPSKPTKEIINILDFVFCTNLTTVLEILSKPYLKFFNFSWSSIHKTKCFVNLRINHLKLAPIQDGQWSMDNDLIGVYCEGIYVNYLNENKLILG